MSHDQKLVKHLRAALDEVAATPAVRATAQPAGHTSDARRWVAVAASLVIVAGAIVGIAMYRGDSTKVAGGQTTLPSTTEPTSTPATMPYFLAAADLAPGPVTDVPGTGADVVVMAWARNGDLADGLLVMEATATPTGTDAPSVATVAGSSERTVDGATLRFTSNGLGDAERVTLASQVVPGSGLPWVLPVDGWEMVGMATPADGLTKCQAFGTGTVSLCAGPFVLGLLRDLAPIGGIAPVTVAGQGGWKLITSGPTVVMWRHPIDGNWVALTVPPGMGDRVDALTAAVVPTSSTPLSITGEPLVELTASEVDLSLGATAPVVVGHDPRGATVTIDPATTHEPTLVVFVANWCPHCHRLLPNIQAWIADGTITAHVVVVTTAESTAAAPSADWLTQVGWTGDVLVDDSNGDGEAGPTALAYGATGWPFMVLLNADGTVAARNAGDLTQAQMTALLAQAG